MARWPALLVAVALVAGCRPAPASPSGQPVTVAAGMFPLAELARRVGLGRVTVTDLTPAGTDPRTAAALSPARVVLLVGRGFQPDLERGQGPGLRLWDALGGDDPYFWLDPVAMQQATDLVAGALAQADPAGRAGYQRAARAFKAQIGALDIDYQSTLAGCIRRDLVTSTGGFARMAARYRLVSHAATDPGVAALIKARDVRTIFTEPPRPTGPTRALAQVAGIKTVPLDLMESRAPDEAARGAGYLTLMTDNLAKLRTALACSGSSP